MKLMNVLKYPYPTFPCVVDCPNLKTLKTNIKFKSKDIQLMEKTMLKADKNMYLPNCLGGCNILDFYEDLVLLIFF